MNTISCDCGKVKVDVLGNLLLRMVCHCTICQRFNDAPAGDLAIFRARDIHVHDKDRVDYQRLRKPPAVDRGVCRDCRCPIVEHFRMPPLPSLVFLPAARLDGVVDLPAPALRAFYESRIEDVDDAIPRYEGYWSSQIAVMKRLVPAMWR